MDVSCLRITRANKGVPEGRRSEAGCQKKEKAGEVKIEHSNGPLGLDPHRQTNAYTRPKMAPDITKKKIENDDWGKSRGLYSVYLDTSLSGILSQCGLYSL